MAIDTVLSLVMALFLQHSAVELQGLAAVTLKQKRLYSVLGFLM
jgi:hypothetical protein